MSAIQDIQVGRGILTLNKDSEQEFSFDCKGCECCNDKAGRTLGADVCTFDHIISHESIEPTEWRLCSECEYNFHYDEEPIDGYEYDKHY